ncbi:MAG: hypothetical protein AABW81_00485 [Nanoarchaeota archaeon]
MAKKKENKYLIWLVDGFNGILALMIYNFSLYILEVFDTFLIKMKENTGYFYIKTFALFGLNKSKVILCVIILFFLAALLGVVIGRIIRKMRKVDF